MSIMKIAFLSAGLTIATASLVTATEHWNQFRGANGDGVSETQDLPTTFDEARNVKWKIAVPDQGWSSPVIWKDEVWLTSGNDDTQELRALCVDLETGKVRHNVKVFDMQERRLMKAYKHDSPHLNSPATPTAVVEDKHVFVSFGSQGIACLERSSGRKLWERRDLQVYQPVRQGSSPIVDETSLYVAYDGIDRQFFVALDKANGETRWLKERGVQSDWESTLQAKGFKLGEGISSKPNDNKKSFATATLISVNGQRQLIAPAGEATIAYDPETGDEIWRVIHPGGFNVSARPIYANGLVYVFTSGVSNDLVAIRPNGRGDVTKTHVEWSSNRLSPRIPSPIVHDGLMFIVSDKGGIARCLDAKTGDVLWTKRLGGNHWASPLYAGGNLYFSSREGEVVVMPAGSAPPEISARNELNASFIASPAVTDSALLLRSTTHLYCLQSGYTRPAAEVAQEMANKPIIVAGGKPTRGTVDWEAAYQKLLKNRPEIRQKVESGGASKEDIITWMKQKSQKQGTAEKQEPVNLEALGRRLKEAVKSGKLTKEEAIAEFERASKSGKGGGKKTAGKGTARKGSGDKGGKGGKDTTGFYAVVIGRLKTKDIELGEFTLQVDHVSSMYGNRWVKDAIVGKTLKVTGVSGQFVDNLLLIKRGATLKVRTGSYLPDSQTLTFGPKFQVLEQTAAFNPDDFGVPPKDFRGFEGTLEGKIVEANGYEVLLAVQKATATSGSKAAKPDIIHGGRVRVIGFYNQHAEKFSKLHEGDAVRISVSHRQPSHDELNVTEMFEQLGDTSK